MITKNKIFSLFSSITIGFVSLTSLSHPIVYAEKVTLNNISSLTIYSPNKSYFLKLNHEECQQAARLIQQKFSREDLIISPETSKTKVLGISIKCLSIILINIGKLTKENAIKIIVDSFLYVSHDQFNIFVFDLLKILEVL